MYINKTSFLNNFKNILRPTIERKKISLYYFINKANFGSQIGENQK